MLLTLSFGVFLLLSAAILLLKAVHFPTLFLSRPAEQPANETPLADRYRPMLRLLSAEDVDVYSSHPACSSSDLKFLRSERIHFFRRYLKLLVKDFSSNLGALESIMMQSNIDRPDLARAINTSRLRFARTLVNVEFRLVLYRYNLSLVDVAPLVNCLSAIQDNFVTPAAYSAAA